MKRTIIALVLMATLISAMPACKKEPLQKPIAARVMYVNDKFYTDSFPFVNGQYRRYWVRCSDTSIVCPPFNPNCGISEVHRIPRSIYDTLFLNRYPEILSEAVFIPDYPY